MATERGLVGPFAHDLRQWLRVIMGTAQRMQRQGGGGLEAEAAARLEEIVQAARRQDELIASVVEYDQALEPEAGGMIPLRLAVQSACMRMESWRAQSGGVLRFDRTAAPEAPVPAAIAKVVERVLHNALKFHAEGEAPVVEIEASEGAAGMIVIRVRDAGIGVDPKYHEMVFEPFRRLHPVAVYPGAGMGLAICRRRMEAMGGTIRFEDTGSAGSVVRIELPAGVA